VFLPSVMLGGLMVPSELIPDTLATVARLLPATHAMNAMRGLAFGEATGVSPLGSLLVLIVGAALAVVARRPAVPVGPPGRGPARARGLGCAGLAAVRGGCAAALGVAGGWSAASTGRWSPGGLAAWRLRGEMHVPVGATCAEGAQHDADADHDRARSSATTTAISIAANSTNAPTP
jgi:hypothetical protein